MPTVLVVEDEPILRRIIADLYRIEGYKVLVAESGNSALKILKKTKVDLIVSDICMPDGDGFKLLTKVREGNPKKPTMIMISGQSNYSEQTLRENGAAAIFNKPFRSDELLKLSAKLTGAT